MTIVHGFELIREESIDEIDAQALLYRHLKSGATLLFIRVDDENKVFGISFRTPPSDSTGVAHIMEHSVLGGSEKYPLKEPFVQLIKGSLKTFLNALTYPDRTVYPVASQNTQDLYNLMEVYLDAVLHPLITPEHLMQEGWHYELINPEDPLSRKGVVYNEMKGAYSSPDSLLYRYSQQELFPDNAYGFDSGGDPAAIPDLTYEEFTDFHITYYHPANALIFCYGDDPVEDRLAIIDAALAGFDHAEVDGLVQLQEPLQKPRTVVRQYDADEAEDATKRGMVNVNWLLPESNDETLIMGLSLLSHVLVGTQAGPLRKRLIDSGLGEEVTGGGLSALLRQMTFAIGLKGIAPDDAAEVESLILETLDVLADSGFDEEMVEASLNTIEFSLRENNTGSFPRGLGLMMNAVRGWLYMDDIMASLRYEAPLNEVRTLLANEPHYLQQLIRQYLLNNTHRVTVVMEPEAGLNRRREEEERRKLAAIRDAMSEETLAEVVVETSRLRALQAQQDTPEKLALLPTLHLSDLEKESKTIPIEQSEAQGSRILMHDLFTNGILYLDLGFDMHQAPEELLPFVKLFGQCLTQIGTETEDFVQLSQRVGRLTGGIHATPYVAAKRDDEQGVAQLFVRGKATIARTGDLLDILRDMLLTVKLDNRERFKQMVMRAKANIESSLIPSGHSVVDGRLRASYNVAGWASEQMNGVDYLLTLRKLVDEIDNDWASVLAKLEEVRTLLINRNALVCNVTVDADTWRELRPDVEHFLADLPDKDVTLQAWPVPSISENEGILLPAQVNYVGKGANLYALGYALDGSISVISNYLRTSFLWDTVRVQGGAYGAMVRFNRQSGVLTFLSYRDPNLLDTLAAYDHTAEFLRSESLSADELEKSVIGAVGTLDAYQLPDAKGFTSMVRELLGVTDEERQQYRSQVLDTSLADVRAFADVLDAVAAQGRVSVLGGEDAVRASAETVPLQNIWRIL